jgi:hypothetical protein
VLPNDQSQFVRTCNVLFDDHIVICLVQWLQPNVIRIAAKAVLLVVGKYYALSDECELYRIAIGTFTLRSSQLMRILLPSHVSTQEA